MHLTFVAVQKLVGPLGFVDGFFLFISVFKIISLKLILFLTQIYFSVEDFLLGHLGISSAGGACHLHLVINSVNINNGLRRNSKLE